MGYGAGIRAVSTTIVWKKTGVTRYRGIHPLCHGPLDIYVKLRVVHALGMPGTFSLPPLVSDPDMHQGTCVTHVPWCMPGSLTGGFLCSRWRGKRSRHSRRMRNPQFYVSGKRPIAQVSTVLLGAGSKVAEDWNESWAQKAFVVDGDSPWWRKLEKSGLCRHQDRLPSIAFCERMTSATGWAGMNHHYR